MSKAARSREDIESVKKKIIEASLEIIIDGGFNQLSMRKIAEKVSMTAANIYNYYSNKDEIYLAIQTRGFTHLYKIFCRIDKNIKNPLLKLEKFIRAYIDFGINNAEYYDIMFTRNTPKFADYVGTNLESTATVEKNEALKVAAICSKVIDKIKKKSKLFSIDNRFRTLQIWTSLHGIVSLYNSRVLQEVDDGVDEFIDMQVNELMKPFTL